MEQYTFITKTGYLLVFKKMEKDRFYTVFTDYLAKQGHIKRIGTMHEIQPLLDLLEEEK